MITKEHKQIWMILFLLINKSSCIVFTKWIKKRINCIVSCNDIILIPTTFKGLLTYIIRTKTWHVGKVPNTNPTIWLFLYKILTHRNKEREILSGFSLDVGYDSMYHLFNCSQLTQLSPSFHPNRTASSQVLNSRIS